MNTILKSSPRMSGRSARSCKPADPARPVQSFDDIGLYGQFPELSLELESWSRETQELLEKARKVILDLSTSSEFRSSFKSMSQDFGLAWNVDEAIKRKGSGKPYKGVYIWSINLGDNHNLCLVFTEDGELVIGTDQYRHQTDHAEGFHWILRHDCSICHDAGLKTDSVRLRYALEVLARPEMAEAYLRAKIRASEMSS